MAGPGRGSAAVVVLVALGLLAAANVASAAQHIVGGETNWTIPSTANNDFNYQSWANAQTFAFGDELVFYYPNGTHDVFLVNSTAFASCDISDQPLEKWNSGEDVIELSQLGTMADGPEFYFICGEPGHCTAGQKFHITVSAYVPPPTASTTPTVPSPPTKNRGSSRSLPQLGALILASAMVLLCTFSVL